MPETKEVIKHGRIQDAVCRLIDECWDVNQKLVSKLEEHCESGRSTKDHAAFFALLSLYCRTQIEKLSAIMQVHHDVLDNTGNTSYLIKATETQDEYHVCLDIIDVLVSNQ